jgi:hypothetical protein
MPGARTALPSQAVYSSLRVESADCFSTADKEWILGQVRSKHGSCEAFDTKLKLQVVARRCRGAIAAWATMRTTRAQR